MSRSRPDSSLGHRRSSHLALPSARGDHGDVLRRRNRATLDDVVELLRGIGTILMEIDAKLARLVGPSEEDEDEEERS